MDDSERGKANELQRLRERLGLRSPEPEPVAAGDEPGESGSSDGPPETLGSDGAQRKDPTLPVLDSEIEEIEAEAEIEGDGDDEAEGEDEDEDEAEGETEPIELLVPGEVEAAGPPAMPTEAARRGQATPMPPPPMPPPAPGPSAPPEERWAPDRTFFHREANALADRQPERAAQMFLEAAAAAERAGQDPDAALADVEAALALRPDSRWLLPAGRRVFLRLRRYERSLELGRREVELGGENAGRTAVLQESAAVLRFCRGERGEALKLLEQALLLDPTNLLLLGDALGVRVELGLNAEAAETLEQLAGALTAPDERALCLYAAGSLRDETLDQPEVAEADYRAAVEADRKSLPAVMALCHHQERRAMFGPLCGSLELLAELVHDPAVEARLLHRAGSLHLDRTGDLEMAARDLARAAQAAPGSVEILRRLATVQEVRGRSRELISTLQRLLELTIDPQSRADLHARMGWLLQSRLGAIDEAIVAYRQALQSADSYLPALQSLSTLYRHRGEWEQLLEIGAPEVEGALPARGRAVRCLEMAEILGRELARPEDAAAWYRRALELDGGLYPAFWGLAKLLRDLGDHERLAEVLAAQAARSQDVKTRNHLLLELARLQAGPQQELDRAVETLEGMREADRTRASAFLLLELYERSGRFAEMTGFLQELAGDAADPAEAQGRRLQAAGIFEQKLEEPGKALALYRQILDEDPDCVAAWRGAGRIHHRLAAWSELVTLHEHELQSDPSRPDAAIVLCRIGRILEENLGQASAAIQAYGKALERDPACGPALPALERLLRGARQWDDLVKVLQRHAAGRMDARLAAEALCRAAEVAETQLDDLPRATNLLLNAQVLHPDSTAVRHALVRVHRRQGAWSALAEVLKELAATATSPEELALLQLELGRVRELRLGQQPDPGLYAKAGEVLGRTLRLERTRVLRRVASPDLADWLERLGGESLDAGLGAAHLLEACHRRELAGARGSALEPARQAFRRRPEELCVVWALERALWREQRWRELGQLREKEALLEIDPPVRVGRLIPAATAFVQGGELEDARRVARHCVELDARCLPALRILAQLAEREQAWDALASLCDRIAEASADVENRLEACLRAADLWAERVGDVPRALQSLGVALADQPAQAQAFSRAERLLRAGARFAELSRLYRRRIKAAPEAERLELMREHARVLRDDLKDAGQAIQQLTELLTLSPDDAPATLELVDLLVGQKHWSDAARTLAVLESRAGDPELRHRARLRQAHLWLHHLHEPRRAQELLAAALDDRPSDIQAKRQMAELCALEGNWDGARQILESLLNEDDARIAAWAGLQLADVARVGLRDEELARRHESEALCVTVAAPAGLGELVAHYRQRRELHRFVELAEAHLEQLTSGDAPRLRAALGRILLEDLAQPPRALEHLRLGLNRAPEDEELRLLFAAALEAGGELGPAAEECRAILDANPGSVTAYRTLARIADRRGQHGLVASAAGLIDLLGAADPEETALLKSLEGTGSPAGSIAPEALPLPDHLAASQRAIAAALPELAAIYPLELTAVLSVDHAASAAASRLARALGMSSVTVGLVEGGASAQAAAGAPVQLALGSALARTPGEGVFRFWVGRALFGAVSGGALVERLTDRELVELAAALGGGRTQSPTVQQLRKQLGRVLPRKLRKQLEAIALPVDEAHWAALRDAERDRCDRAGLLFSRTPRDGLVALGETEGRRGRALLGSARLAPLIRFVLSDEYARLAAGLWA